MDIKFNEVTWYSKAGALVLFFVVIPILSFYIGREYQKMETIAGSGVVYLEPIKNVSGNDKTKLSAGSNSGLNSASQQTTRQTTQQKDYFSSIPRSAMTSNIVGYISYGAFVLELPDWVEQNWTVDSSDDGGMTVFKPRLASSTEDRDFSDIVFTIKPTTELHNADYLYSVDSANKGNINVSGAKGELVNSEVMVNKMGDMRIYHIVRVKSDNKMVDTYYMDGNGKTATVDFEADSTKYGNYGSKVRDLIQGFGIGAGAQG